MTHFFVTEYFWPDVGGLEQSVYTLARALGELAPVSVLAPRNAQRFTEREGVTVSRIGTPTTPFYDGVKAHLREHARSNDVVCVFGFSLHDLDAQVALLEYVHESLGLRLLFKVPSMGEFSEASTVADVVRGLSFVDRILCLNEAITDELVREGVAQLQCVPFINGVDTSRFRPPTASERAAARSKLSLGDEIVCSFVGRFVRRKRVDLLAEAANGVKNVLALLVGYEDTRFEPSLGIDRYRGEHVRVVSPGVDVLPAYFASDVYVSASEREGLPNAMLEAMATGLPVVASDVPGHNELVQSGVNGFLFKPNSVSSLVNHLLELRDATSRKALGLGARHAILERYSAEAVAKRYLDLVS